MSLDTNKLIDCLVENTKQIFELTKSVNALKVPQWKEIIITGIPFLAIISAFSIGWFVPKWMFKSQREFELKKKKDADKVDKINTYKKMYSEITSLNALFQGTVNMMNHYLILSHYTIYCGVHYKKIDDLKLVDEFKMKDEASKKSHTQEIQKLSKHR